MIKIRPKRKKLESNTVSSQLPSYVVFETELGWMGCVWQSGKLDAVTFGHPSRAGARATCTHLSTNSESPGESANFVLEPADMGDEHVASVVARLTRFAAGEDDDFRDVKIDLAGKTSFQKQVIELCRKIPAGRALSYGELATKAGSPGAARAVGSVMAKNRFPLIVPCHRVIGSGGSLGGYSAPNGLPMKRRLLAREGFAVK